MDVYTAEEVENLFAALKGEAPHWRMMILDFFRDHALAAWIIVGMAFILFLVFIEVWYRKELNEEK